jgi:hypothetical protein
MNDPLSATSDGRLTDASKPRIFGMSVLDLFCSYGIVLVTSRDSNANNSLGKQMFVPARQGYETGATGRIRNRTFPDSQFGVISS